MDFEFSPSEPLDLDLLAAAAAVIFLVRFAAALDRVRADEPRYARDGRLRDPRTAQQA